MQKRRNPGTLAMELSFFSLKPSKLGMTQMDWK